MPILAVQCRLNGTSGLAEDRFINVWHVWADSASDTDQLDDIATAFSEFYGPDGRSGFKLFGSQIANNGFDVAIYNVEDAIPRVPIHTLHESSNPFGVITEKSLPTEVAVCLSFSAVPVSGTIPARRRGRVFLGPWNAAALADGSTGGAGRVHDSLQGAIISQAGLLCSELNAADAALVTYSPTSDAAGQTTLQSSKLVYQFWCDDAWDTQRRRGLAPTQRNTMLADQDPLVFLDL